MSEGVSSARTQVVIWFILLILTILNVQFGLINFGGSNGTVAFGIAAVQALLVASFFMPARYRGGAARLLVLVAIVFVVLMLLGILDDYWTRDRLPLPGR
ncbi:MAG: cytochrome C oxidase subunit IV family protein [Chloroflexi bacterium]|nr:cytochrome C oxidase subunit IV family protein [Chloroflexota bacterium]